MADLDMIERNGIILRQLQYFLIYNDAAITTNQMEKMMKLGLPSKRAFQLLLRQYLDFAHDDFPWVDQYLSKMINELSFEYYSNNEYYKNIILPNKKSGKWRLGHEKYKAYQSFICRDYLYDDNGAVYPQIGYFTKPFPYPAIYENDVLWMSVTPNEIETMKKPIELAKGNVLTCGLGLGYYAYMVSQKADVQSLTIIEKDPQVIALFKQIILPQFDHQDKITIIAKDALEYLSNDLYDGQYHEIFIDLWHDAGDGLMWYKQLTPRLDKLKKTHVSYWIEDTIKYYLK